jgi:hypothetical protein
MINGHGADIANRSSLTRNGQAISQMDYALRYLVLVRHTRNGVVAKFCVFVADFLDLPVFG